MSTPEKVNKITLSVNDNERIQPINSIETYAYETSKGYISKEKIKCKNKIDQCKND